MKKLIAAIRKEHQSELDKFNKLPDYERVSFIILAVGAVAFALSGHAYALGELIGSKLGSMIV